MQKSVLSLSRALSVIVILCSTTAMSQRSNSGLQDHSVPGIGVSSQSPYLSAPHPSDLPTVFRNTAKETPSQTSIGSVFVVTTMNDTGNGSLRKAISDANNSPGADTITFSISPAGPKTITPLSKLPNIVDPVTIDGTTQPGFVDKPMIELNCSSIGSYQAFDVFSPSTIRGFVVNRLTGGSCIVLWEGSNGSRVEGNFFGTNLAGTVRVGNAFNAIISRSASNRIGGTSIGTKNVFAGHGNPPIALIAGGNGNVVQGNLIGTDVTGTVRLGNNEDGILVIFGAREDTIGGTTAAARNVISASANFSGIAVIGTGATGTQGIIILGNHIGTDVTGNLDFGNARQGIYIRHAPRNVIGGTDPGARNIISGNTLPGILIDSAGATNNIIQGNFIGTRPSGTFALSNSKGIVVNEAPGNLIGGTEPGARNVITGNSGVGIEIQGAGATGNKVQGNYIGADPSGQAGPKNLGHGILVNASQDTIGGVTADARNLIAFNGGAGVFIAGGTQNLVLNNIIHSNTGLGIDLYPAGVTINDSLDVDSGANGLLNFPLLDSAIVTPTQITIKGRYYGAPVSTFALHFYKNSSADPLHFGEGDSSIGTIVVQTLSQGYASFTVTLPIDSMGNQFVTALATQASGNTSEFSQALCVNDLDGDGIMDCWETKGWGIDINSDNVIDLDLEALGARPDHKDLFVEVDAMEDLQPHPRALQKVRDAFAAVPHRYVNNPDGAPGINLHIQRDDTTLRYSQWTTNWWTSFYNLKEENFGTLAERSHPDSVYILDAKRLVFRYCVFAHSYDTTGSSGMAEGIFSNDFFVTLGRWRLYGGSINEQAGTFMHELGHTLGLRHGGGDNINYKPNYYSVMSYTWQFPCTWLPDTSWKLDYSPEAIPTLDEANLSEQLGLNPPAGVFPTVPVPFGGPLPFIKFAKLKNGVPVDWDTSGAINTTPVSFDLNIIDLQASPRSEGDMLIGHADWPSLLYNFRHSNWYTVNRPQLFKAAPDEFPELDLRMYDLLNSLPPPIPQHFVMDGQIDPEAIRITSGNGIALYAAYRDGELYVATNSAQSQNADMFIFVTADFENSGVAAPWSKSGQVAAWDAFLANESADNSVGWYNANGKLRGSITKATAGSDILEGVIDLEFMVGRVTFNAVLAVGQYQTEDGGLLLAQAPPGDDDGNIGENEDLYSYIPGTQRFWYQTAGPASPDVFSLLAVGPDEIYAGTGTGIFKTMNGGDSWTQLTVGLPVVQVSDFERASNGNVYAATDSGVFLTTNSGATWQLRVNGLSDPNVHAVLASPQGSLFAGTLAGGYRSTDEGMSWTLMGGGLPSDGIRALAMDSSGYILAGSSSQGLFRSTDDGLSWLPTGMSAPNVRSITVDQSGRIYYVKSSPSIVYRSSDDGLSWTNILFTSMHSQEIGVDQGGRIYSATAEGVLLSTNDGTTWEDISGGIPNTSTWSLVITSNNNIYVGTFTSGVCRRLPSSITSVVDPPDVLPAVTLLTQNYPNPFNPSTTINYELAKSSVVKLSVYDVLGRAITSLVNEEKPAGRYSVKWDATGVSSGVYFYRLQTGTVVETRRMLLVR